ncbi:MAG: PKD domain-containing protein [Pseudomonadota bacterium]
MKTIFSLSLLLIIALGIFGHSWGASDPIVEYLFNEGSGTTALNSGSLGDSTNGTINGATYSSDTPSDTGFSLEFDGINDFVRVLDTFDYTDQLTIEACIKPDAVSGQRIIWDDYGNPGVVFAVWDGLVEFAISTQTHPGLGIGVHDGTVTTGEWRHIAGIYDGSEMKVYINGVHTGKVKDTSGNIIDNPGPPSYAAIGSSNVEFWLLNFDGKIDDFRIFNTALDSSELADGFFENLIPVANFTADNTSGVAPLTVNFSDTSTGDITDWLWDFGDNSNSTNQNPIHIYSNPGTYTVSLTVTGPYGSDTETKADYIVVEHGSPVANFTADNTIGVAPLTINFTDASAGDITSRLWDFGDNETSTEENPAHTYDNPGIYTVSLSVSGPHGNDTEVKLGYITVSEPDDNDDDGGGGGGGGCFISTPLLGIFLISQHREN